MVKPVKRQAFSSFVIVLLSSCWIHACGLNWSIPSGPFPNISDQGVLSTWEKLGDIPTSDEKFRLPIYFNFRANRNSQSPGLGVPGFALALTDADAIALDENTFLVHTPAGRYKIFNRDKKQPAILHSGGDWKGEISENTITIYSECGDRIKYVNGAISEFQVKSQRFSFVRVGGRVTEVREAGNILATFAKDPMTGNLRIDLPLQKSIVLEFGERPIIQNLAGSNVIAAKVPSVKTVTLPDERTINFEFGATEKIFPSVTYGDRKLVWDPSNGTLLRDGDLTYSVQQKEEPFSDATITRTNAAGKSEFISTDERKGIKVEIDSAGIKKETVRFTSGVARGSIRRIEWSKDGKVFNKSIFSYDEQGFRIRELNEKGGKKTLVQFTRETNKDGSIVAKAVSGDGALLWERIKRTDGSTREVEYATAVGKADKIVDRDKDGRLSYRRDDRGFEYRNLYDSTGKLQAILHSDKIQRRFFYDPATNELQREIRFAQGGNIVVGVKDFFQGYGDIVGSSHKWIGANQLPADIRENMVREAANFLKTQYLSQ